MVTVRKYRREDQEPYLDLLLLTSSIEYESLHRRDIKAMLDILDKEWVWVAVEEKRQIGFLAARPERGSLHIIWLDVHPDRQRGGLGSLLLKEAIEAGKSFGLTPMTVEVYDGNDKGINFYEKHGFKRKDHLENYYRNGRGAYQMVKDL
jgi:ribosomal protein S18 acetylase RimI-like enzyme